MNGIEKDLEGRARVVRFNMLTKLGRQVAKQYDVRVVPTTIIFDDGDICYRHEGVPNRKAIVEQIA